MNKINALTLSIIIPAYNEENQIVDCLKSIEAQTQAPNKVFVVDNNCSDKTVILAKKFSFVTIIKESNQGIVYARNAGFNKVTTDIIARIDADTQLPSNWVKNVVDHFAKTNHPIAISGPCSFRDWYGKWFLFYGHRVVFFIATRVFVGHNTLFGSNMALRTKDWRKIKNKVCIDNKLHEDMDLAAHLQAEGVKILFERDIKASISPRRIKKMRKYPGMWLRTNLRH
jgi:glycosyltransferase involved in cell wall biosynthesis